MYNFNIHHHLLIRFVTLPIYIQRFFLSQFLAWMVVVAWWSFTLDEMNLHTLQIAITAAFLMAFTNYGATAACLA